MSNARRRAIAVARCAAAVACSLARELLSQACQRRRLLEIGARVRCSSRRYETFEKRVQMGAARTRMKNQAKGNHGLAACKTLGFSPRPTRLVATGRGTTPGRRDAMEAVREDPVPALAFCIAATSTWHIRATSCKRYALEAQINCIAVSTQISQLFERPATTTTHSSL